MSAAGGRDLPEVAYGDWQADLETRPGWLVRGLSCTRCGAPLAMQETNDPGDPYTRYPWSHPWPEPGSTLLRSGMILFPKLTSMSAPGLPVFGQTAAERRGKRPRSAAGARMVSGPLPSGADRWDPGNEALAAIPLKELRRGVPQRVRRGPAMAPGLEGYGSALPGHPDVWFDVDVEPPLELYCPRCPPRQLLTGIGPEGPRSVVVPRLDLSVIPGVEAAWDDTAVWDMRIGTTNIEWRLACTLNAAEWLYEPHRPPQHLRRLDALWAAMEACDADALERFLLAACRATSTHPRAHAALRSALDYVRLVAPQIRARRQHWLGLRSLFEEAAMTGRPPLGPEEERALRADIARLVRTQ